MRILVVGAGAIGGYFGGRMLQAGADVTFLVRQRRAAELAAAGLVIKSPLGDVTLKNPPAVQADKLTEKFDVVLLSCKAFDLDDAIKSFAPAVGPNTAILPLLNGMRHLESLDAQFGRERVLGGLCAIAVTLNEKREVVHLQPLQSLTFGERDGRMTDRVRAIAEILAKGNFGSKTSEEIILEMWEKWVFLASLAASHLPDADVGRKYPGLAGRQGFCARHARRMQRGCRRRRPCAARAVSGTHPRHADGRRLANDGVDVPRHQGRRAGRGRPRDRRPGRPRRRRQGAGAEAAHRVYASEGV